MLKKYKVYFSRTAVGADGIPMTTKLVDAHAQFGDHLPVVDFGDDKFQIRNLQRVGRVWKGAFARLRDEAPHVGSPQGDEREIELEENEHIIEKCFFLYREVGNVVVWQTNRSAGGLTRFENYLAQVLNDYVTLPQVMNDGELQRVLDGNVYEIDFAYDRPPQLFAGAPAWNQRAFDMMSSVDAAHAKFTLRAPRSGRLLDRAKEMIQEMLPTAGVAKVRVRLTDESEPLELFMAPLKDTIEVEVLGRYPSAASAFQELEASFGRMRDLIPNING